MGKLLLKESELRKLALLQISVVVDRREYQHDHCVQLLDALELFRHFDVVHQRPDIGFHLPKIQIFVDDKLLNLPTENAQKWLVKDV